MVSEKNEIKTRRYWRPNVQQKRMWSGYLNTFIRTRITTRIIRTVDKVGGLDEYLLGNSKGRIKELGVGGWKLRWRVMQTQGAKQRFREERLALGLPEHGELGEFRGINGELVAEEELQNQMDAFDAVLGEEELEMGESEAPNEGFMREDPVRKDDKVIL
jgi:large subunit ribosomal protein L28